MISSSAREGILTFESFYWLLLSFFVITIFALLSVPGSSMRESALEEDFCISHYTSEEKQQLCRQIVADLQD